MTDLRNLIRQLADELELWIFDAEEEDIERAHSVVDEARAYLALESEGPTDEELQSMLYYEFSTSTGHGTREDPIGFARAVLARYGNRTPAPIPLSERQPTEADCDVEGRCWGFTNAPHLDGVNYSTWKLIPLSWIRIGNSSTHWLPHWALPVPEQEVGK